MPRSFLGQSLAQPHRGPLGRLINWPRVPRLSRLRACIRARRASIPGTRLDESIQRLWESSGSGRSAAARVPKKPLLRTPALRSLVNWDRPGPGCGYTSTGARPPPPPGSLLIQRQETPKRRPWARVGSGSHAAYSAARDPRPGVPRPCLRRDRGPRHCAPRRDRKGNAGGVGMVGGRGGWVGALSAAACGLGSSAPPAADGRAAGRMHPRADRRGWRGGAAWGGGVGRLGGR